MTRTVLSRIMTDRWESVISRFEPIHIWSRWPIIRWFFKSGWRGILLSIITFGFYYIIPNIASCIEGTCISKETSSNLIDHGFPEWTMFASRLGVGVPAFEDFAHFSSAFLVLFIGVNLGALALRLCPEALTILSADSGLKVSRETYIEVTEKLSKKLHSPLLLIFPAIIAVLILVSFLHLENIDGLNSWWAHRTHGIAGTILAISVALASGIGIFTAEVFLLFFLAFRRLFQSEIKLRPFHPDGCGGFIPLGIFFFVLYFLLLMCGITLLVVYWKGYFGLEDQLIYWIVVILYLFIVFLFVFIPLIVYSFKIDREKRKKIREIEEFLEKEVSKVVNENTQEKDAPKLGDISNLHDIYSKHPITPFAGRTFAVMFGTYLLQVLMALYGLF